jgi:replicative DNA helicase
MKALSEESTSFSKYGTRFQENLCQVILDDRAFTDQISEVLDIEFLELKYLRTFITKLLDYRDKYGSHPSRDTLTTILRTELDDEGPLVTKQVREYFARVLAAPENVSDVDYIKETALDFCKKQKLKEAMLKTVPLIQKSSYEEISTIINDALKLGQSNNFGYDYLKDFESRFEIKARNPISTGWSEFDKLCNGGLGSGELGCVIAPTGAGKSMVLVHLGAEAVARGLTVVHYTLELADTVVATRYDSRLTGIPLGQVLASKDEVYEIVKNIPGRLIVKEYPTKTASTQTIKVHLDKLKAQDINVDLVIVDYGDLLRPVKARKEKRTELESIYEELRGLAQIHECPVWTASQTNRSGLNAEVITMEAISEAFNKCFVSDFIFTVSRTVMDKNNNTGRAFIAKNRNGPDGLIFPIEMDTSTVSIKVLPQNTTDITAVFATTAKQQAETLKDKYKKFKQQNRGENV